MTVTYVFRAKSRPARGLPDEVADVGILADKGIHSLAAPHRFTIPVAQPTEPAPAAPLLLDNRVDAAPKVDPDRVPEAAKIISASPAILTNLPATYVPKDGRIILVAKARGGIGATTLAVNLALEMQMQAIKHRGPAGARVALVDLDVQLGNAGSLLDLADRGGMLALAQLGPDPDAQAVRHAMVRHPSGLNVLTAPATAIPFEAFDIKRISCIFDALSAENDVVFVDLPPALINWLDPLLLRAERLLMVTDLAVPSIVRARRIISLLTESRPTLPVDVVVAHEKKPFRAGQIHRDAEAALGHPLRHWLPGEAKLARQSLDRGEPLVQLAPRCGWSKAVRGMASDLHVSMKIGAKATVRRDQ